MSVILQDMLQVAPYYLLDNSTSVADILFFDPASADVTDGGATQGELRSNTTDNSALMTLVVHYLKLQTIVVNTCVSLMPCGSLPYRQCTCLLETLQESNTVSLHSRKQEVRCAHYSMLHTGYLSARSGLCHAHPPTHIYSCQLNMSCA